MVEIFRIKTKKATHIVEAESLCCVLIAIGGSFMVLVVFIKAIAKMMGAQ